MTARVLLQLDGAHALGDDGKSWVILENGVVTRRMFHRVDIRYAISHELGIPVTPDLRDLAKALPSRYGRQRYGPPPRRAEARAS